ncbi:MAG: TlpA disulfide reductase family protein [Planctomycetota bacterium]|jgi:thiol-disulfide isomerase/thioredoxin
MGIGKLLALVAALLVAALMFFRMILPVQPSEEGPAVLLPGPWRASLSSPGGELPFLLEFEALSDTSADARAQQAVIVNGEERIPVKVLRWEDGKLVFDLRHYNSQILAHAERDGSRLVGEWMKRRGEDAWERLPFTAEAGDAPRFEPRPGTSGASDARLTGRWSVRFSSDDDPAVGDFTVAPDGSATGTFLTTTGDYRYLSGRQDGSGLRLSCFDGAHAFLFTAEAQPDGTLQGDFWSGASWHDTWSARRDDTAALPDAFQQTQWTGSQDLSALAFPDLEGTLRTLDDPLFAGRARIVQLFGSWCPNCHDASDELVRLAERYGPGGLSILGLAFEVTGDRELDATQVRAYARRHRVTWPLLIAGLADKTEATRALGVLDRVRSFPTTIFLHGDGRVRAVHSGFSGPATGQAFLDQRAEFESLIEELLAEETPAVEDEAGVDSAVISPR